MTVETALRTEERIAELVNDLDSIITLPQVAARILMTVNDPKSTPADLHRIVAHDPALVAGILKQVNSSYYALARKVDSVERAIILLGYGAVRNLAAERTVGQLFQNVDLCDHFRARTCGYTASRWRPRRSEMAKQYCKPLAEAAFLAGIIHNVGLLVELQVCPDQLRKVCEGAAAGRGAVQHAGNGVDRMHALRAGRSVGKAMGLPGLLPCRRRLSSLSFAGRCGAPTTGGPDLRGRHTVLRRCNRIRPDGQGPTDRCGDRQ